MKNNKVPTSICPRCTSTKIMAESNGENVCMVCQICLLEGPKIKLIKHSRHAKNYDEIVKLWNGFVENYKNENKN